jgi:ribosome-associated toxin RatA of RatAB toxin-antitoxin module
MADQSTQSIMVEAPPDRIMAVIADFPAYPQWATSVKRIEVLEDGADGRARRVRFQVDAGAVRDQYELSYVWSGDEKVEWDLVQGQMQKAQHGSYVLTPHGASTEVTYSLSVELAMPMIGMLRRKLERIVLDTALKELKKQVEAAGG